jgi:hypothetical protein
MLKQTKAMVRPALYTLPLVYPIYTLQFAHFPWDPSSVLPFGTPFNCVQVPPLVVCETHPHIY